MTEDLKKMTNEEIQALHKEATKFAALIDNGIRIGVNTPKFNALKKMVQDRLEQIESEHYTRFPDAAIQRPHQFLTFCDQNITAYNIGTNETDLEAPQNFIEYNKPTQDQKTIYWHGLDGDKKEVSKPVVAPMKGNDFLYAALEAALDEWAKTLPEIPQENK